MQRAQKRAEAKDLDDSVSGKWVNDVVDTVSDTVSDVGGAITDGTGLVGDALSDAYNNAADQAGVRRRGGFLDRLAFAPVDFRMIWVIWPPKMPNLAPFNLSFRPPELDF